MGIGEISESVSRIAEEIREYRNQKPKIFTIPVVVTILSLAISVVLVAITLSQLQTSQDTFAKAHSFEKLKEAEKLAERLRKYYEEGAKFHALREVSLVSLISLIDEQGSLLPVEYNGIVADDFRKRKEYDKAFTYYLRIADNSEALMYARVTACRYLGQISYILENSKEGQKWYKEALAIPVGDEYHKKTYEFWENWDKDAAEEHKLVQNN